MAKPAMTDDWTWLCNLLCGAMQFDGIEYMSVINQIMQQRVGAEGLIKQMEGFCGSQTMALFRHDVEHHPVLFMWISQLNENT